jgi:hypothetical protein
MGKLFLITNVLSTPSTLDIMTEQVRQPNQEHLLHTIHLLVCGSSLPDKDTLGHELEVPLQLSNRRGKNVK